MAPPRGKYDEIVRFSDLYYRETPDGTMHPLDWFNRSQNKKNRSSSM